MSASEQQWLVRYDTDGEQVEVRESGAFDELVLGTWCRIERMDARTWWLRVGDARVWVVGTTSPPVVNVVRGFYTATNGSTEHYVSDAEDANAGTTAELRGRLLALVPDLTRAELMDVLARVPRKGCTTLE